MPSMAAVVRMYVKIDEASKSWVCNRCTAEAEAAGKDPVQKTFSLTGGTSNIVRHFREYHEEVFRPNAEWTKEFPHGGVTTKIHDYYDVIDVNLYSCTLCQKQVKASTSANLLLHFRTTHQAAYEEYLKLSGKRKKRRTEEHRVDKYRDGGEPAQKLFKGDVVEEEAYEWQESTLEDHEYVEDSSAKIIHLGEEIEEEPAEEIVSVVKAADDPLKMFFLTMYESVKRLPKKDIFQVRRRIFDLVCESEEQQHYEDVEEHPRKD